MSLNCTEQKQTSTQTSKQHIIMSLTKERNSNYTIPVFKGTASSWSLHKRKSVSYLTVKGWIQVIENGTKGGTSTKSESSSSSSDQSSDPVNEENKNLNAAESSLASSDDLSQVKVTTAMIEKVRQFFLVSLPDQVLELLGATVLDGHPSKIWSTLCQLYERDTVASKQACRSMLAKGKLKRGEDPNFYVARINELVAKLEAMGETVSDSEKVHYLFEGLTKEYDVEIRTLSMMGGTFTSCVRHIQDKYEKIQFGGNREEIDLREESANFAAGYQAGLASRNGQGGFKSQKGRQGFNGNKKYTSTKVWNCTECKMDNHSTENCGRLKQKKQPGSCWQCGGPGHFQRDCNKPKMIKKEEKVMYNNENEESEKSEQSTSESEDEFAGFNEEVKEFGGISCDSRAIMSNVSRAIKFIADSGTTSHCVNDRNLLTDLKYLEVPVAIRTANNQIIQVEQSGNCKLQGIGGVINLHDVKYSDQFSCNLLSISRLSKKGYIVEFGKKEAKIVYNGKIVLIAKRIGNLYHITSMNKNSNNNSTSEVCNLVETENAAVKLAHARFGHLSCSSLNKVIKANAVINMENIKINEKLNLHCEPCQLGKAHRKPFSKHSSKPKAKNILDCLHLDTMGPFTIDDDNVIVDVLGNIKYQTTITDEKSREICVKSTKSKSEIANQVIDYIKLAERSTGRKVKEIHMDGGSEFNNKTLLDYCRNNGIKVSLTTIHTPQHNGIAERVNRTLMEMARSMLFHAKLPIQFWSEAVQCASKILNYRISRGDEQGLKTPFEIWTGTKPDYNHLKVFGCDAFVHIPKSERSKLEPKSIKCIYLGPDSIRENGYRFYDNTNNKIIISRDATFDENSFTVGRNRRAIMHQQLDQMIQSHATSSNSNHQHSNQHQHSTFENNIESDNESEQSDDSSSPTSNQNNIEAKQANDGTVDIDTENYYQSLSEPSIHVNTTQSSKSVPNRILTRSQHRSAQQSSAINSSSERRYPSRRRLASGLNLTEGDIYDIDRQNVSFAVLDNISVIDLVEPQTYKQVLNSPQRTKWEQAMEKELASLKSNDTWSIVPLPKGANVIGSKWVFKIKSKADGTIDRFKARFCAKGFSQIEGLDFNETFAPVVRYKSLKIILVLANEWNYEIKQLDVVSAFLHADIKETVYMKQPEGFHQGGPNMVCKLNKTLYGTKQAPMEWNSALNGFIVSKLGYKRLVSDTCVYVKISKTNKIMILSIFVDDIISVYDTSDEQEWKNYTVIFTSNFEMKDIGDCIWVLGMEVIRDRKNKTLILSHQQYLIQKLK